MMTPQQLIDLPYAGMAEKQLKEQGDWHDPDIKHTDRIYRLEEALERIETEARNAL